MAFLRLLRRPHLAMLWLSQVLSSFGDNLYNVAVIWTAVNVAGASAGLVVAAGFVTRIVCGPVGGVLADRLDRRRAMIGVDVGRAAAVAVLPLLHETASIELWHLAVISVLINALGSVFDPALQASLPELVGDREDVVAMNGLMDGTRRLALALAPSLTGALAALMPLPQFFTVDAISFVVSAAALLAIARHFAPQAQHPLAGQPLGFGAVVSDIAEATRLVRRNAVLSFFLVNQAFSNLAWAPAYNVGAALLASRELDGEVGSYGLILGAYGAGNIASNIVVGNMRVGRPTVMLSSARIVQAAGTLILAFAGSLPVAMAGSFIAAVGGPMADLMLLAVMHRDTPSQIGKVYALRMTLASVGVFAGLLLAGPLYSAVDVRTGIALCAALMLATGVAGFARFGLGTPSSERSKAAA
jgi:MFS family permease